MISPPLPVPPVADASATRPASVADATIPHHGGAGADSPAALGGYELLAEIARGGMGVVYRHRQIGLGREVAVKMILAGGFAGPEAVARFRREASAAARLDHPHILPVYDIGQHDGHPYFSMKLVTGGTLAERLTSADRPPVRDLVLLLSHVCRGVDHAHRHGILHRDLKPANVLLDAAGCPYVADFGVAKTGDGTTTQTGAVVGTPAYMAPEQARAEKALTPAADVYSLGAMLFEVLAGRPPFRGDSVVDLLLKVVQTPPPHPREFTPDADPALSAVALKCLSKSPADRYPSAAALADDLDRWLAGQPVQARPRRRWGRREWLLTAGGSVLAGTAGVLTFNWFQRDQSLDRLRETGLRIGTDPNYPPMEFLEGGAFAGFDVELGTELAKRLGVAAKIVTFEWDWRRAVDLLNAREVDAVISCVTILPERQPDAAFVQYLELSQAFVCRAGVVVKELKDLKGKKVAVQTDTTGEVAVRQAEMNGVGVSGVIAFTQTHEPFDAIAAGEVDVIVADEPAARYFASKVPGLTVTGVVGHALDPDRIGIALRKTDAALIAAVQDAVDRMKTKQDGAFAALLDKWLPK